MAEHICLRNVRCAYPNLFTPTAGKFDEGKLDANGEQLKNYTVQVRLYDIDGKPDPQVAKVQQAMKKVASEKWGEKGNVYLKSALDSKNTRFLQRNDEEGYWSFNTKRKSTDGKPKVVDRNPNVVLTPDDGKPLSGDFINVVLDLWAYDVSGNRGFSSTLCGVQFVAKGEPIGSVAAVQDGDFETYADDNSSDDEMFY